MVRVVRRPDGGVVLDEHGTLEGRGAYLCAAGSCWTMAIKRSSLERALRSPLPAELRTQLERGVVAPNPLTTGRRAPQLMQGGRHGS